MNGNWARESDENRGAAEEEEVDFPRRGSQQDLERQKSNRERTFDDGERAFA